MRYLVTSLIASLLVAGCATQERIVTVEIPVERTTPIPEELTRECYLPDMTIVTWADVARMTRQAIESINKCNADKRALRELNKQ